MTNLKLLNTFSRLCIFAMAVSVFSCKQDDEVVPIDEMPDHGDETMAPDANFTALTNDNQIAWFNAQNLNSPMNTVAISGLEDGEHIVSIDYRPATGQLYALGASSRLYIINENSGLATALGESSFSPALSSDNASLDFNPTVDRIRVVTASGQNLRLHPELGTVVAEDGDISGGDNPMIGAVAYTNSVAGASSTVLFDIDFAGNILFEQEPPNDGGLREVGPLGVDFMGRGNFDINPDNSLALAVTLNDDVSTLYTINLHSGAAAKIGAFDAAIIGIAFKTNPVAYASTSNNMLERFNPMSPEMNAVALTGLEGDEYVVGLDFRPVNGQLYAITNMSRMMTVNTANGTLTEVGSGLMPELEGTSFGFDFNPTVDRIRLVSDAGQNLRLHPDLGTVVAIDGDLNPGHPFVNAAAYANNIASAETTVLYVLDSEDGMLYKQDPPNDGVLVSVGSLGISFSAENGFDIGGNSDNAFALLGTAEGTAVYSIDLGTGAASKVADFNIDATAMAVGLGF